MTEISDPRWERRLAQIAAGLEYPPTPDLSRRLADTSGQLARRVPNKARRIAFTYTAIALALVAAGILAVPQARAAFVEFVRFGAVRLLFGGPTPTASPTLMPLEATPTPVVLSGRMSLAEAQEQALFPIRLPSYPSDLGAPDEVYLQVMDGQMVLTLWRNPDGSARLALYHLTNPEFATKAVEQIQRTFVGNLSALWARGPHFVHFQQGMGEIEFVAGDVLIWTDHGVTYRLESNLPLEEAVRIAESLR